MNMDLLIATLAADAAPVRRHAVAWRLAAGLAAGATATALMVALLLGLRPDLGAAMHSLSFWLKSAYTLWLAAAAIHATGRLARPDAPPLHWLRLFGIPVLIAGAAELARAPSRDWLAMWLGQSWKLCPWLVLSLALPLFFGLLWSFRRLAPTRLRAAGAAAGLASGACAAAIYCLHCPEVSAIFVLTWYSLGIALAGALGALLGPRLLRW
jgi:hypothetical protein